MLLQVNRLSNLLQELKESIADQIKKKKKNLHLTHNIFLWHLMF